MEGKTANIDTVKVTAEVNGVQRVEKIVNDYNILDNKPQINNIELTGNKTLDELNIQQKGDYVIDSNYVHTDNNYSDDDKTKLDGLSNYTLPKASDSVLGGIKIGDNLNIDEEGKVSVIVTDGEDGATFTPSVDDSGNLSWTNDKSLPNPEPVNIKGPKGDAGDQGPQGLPGPTGPGVPTGGTTGQVLSKNSDSDYDTVWKDIESGGGGQGITVLVGTDESPIDFINGMQDEGIYLISGKVVRNTPGKVDTYSSPVLCFISKYMVSAASNDLIARFMFDFNGGPSLLLGGVTKGSSPMVWSEFELTPSQSFYYNGATNKTVSERLFYNYTGLNTSTNINNLQTTDKSSLVGAINELVSRIEALEGTGE